MMMNLSMWAEAIIALGAFIHAEDDESDRFLYLKQLLAELQKTHTSRAY
jgi:hypothetical protein